MNKNLKKIKHKINSRRMKQIITISNHLYQWK